MHRPRQELRSGGANFENEGRDIKSDAVNAIDGQRSNNESFVLLIEQHRSELEDLDYGEAISRFNQEMLALQAAQQSFVKVQGLSLFNFIR